jgi:hypothetical protein
VGIGKSCKPTRRTGQSSRTDLTTSWTGRTIHVFPTLKTSNSRKKLQLLLQAPQKKPKIKKENRWNIPNEI